MNTKQLLQQAHLLYISSNEECDEVVIDVFLKEIHYIRRYLIDNKTKVSVNHPGGGFSVIEGTIIGLVVAKLNNGVKVAVRLMTDDGVYTTEASEIK